VSVRYNPQQLAYARRNPPKNYEYLVAVNRDFENIYSGLEANIQRMARAEIAGKKKK